ncbi:MAG: hypothetical protein K2M34_02830 [Alphaproteobacteria bacterium]|nr:hypothetical protein [Alphaproteobacteria bacterium]
MRKIKINTKYCILGAAAGIAGFSLGQIHQLHNQVNTMFEIHTILQDSYNIASVNCAKLEYLNDAINMLQYIENPAVADSLQQSLTHKQDSIAHTTSEQIRKNKQQIQQIAQKNNIKIK